MTKSKYILPKPHLSWSQMTCWESSPARYRREYFEAGRKLDTKYLRFGKGIAEMIEKNEHTDLLPDLEVYDTPEYKIVSNVRGVPILSFVDTYNDVATDTVPANVFREYKTGKIPWTKAKVIKHGQLLFYAVALKYDKGVAPLYCHLDWIQTKVGSVEVDDFWRKNEKEVQITGKIVEFRRDFDERELDKMEERIVKAAEGIEEAYREFIKEI